MSCYNGGMLKRLLLLLIIFSPMLVYASEVRFNIEPSQTSAHTGDTGLSIKAQLRVSDTDTNLSVGEQAEFRITNARDGDACSAQNGSTQTDTDGFIYATCKATQSGELKVYAYSIAKDDRSNETTLTFTDTPSTSPTVSISPTATPAPTTPPSTSTSTPTPSVKKSPIPMQSTNNSSGFGGPGLVDDPPETGLSNGNGKTLGATDELKTNDAGDADLLKTLIFLTGAAVLIVWSTYMVLVQRGVITGAKKNKRTSPGITPQSIE